MKGYRRKDDRVPSYKRFLEHYTGYDKNYKIETNNIFRRLIDTLLFYNKEETTKLMIKTIDIRSDDNSIDNLAKTAVSDENKLLALLNTRDKRRDNKENGETKSRHNLRDITNNGHNIVENNQESRLSIDQTIQDVIKSIYQTYNRLERDIDDRIKIIKIIESLFINVSLFIIELFMLNDLTPQSN